MKDFDIMYKNITSASHILAVCFLTESSQNVDINKSVIIAPGKNSSYMYGTLSAVEISGYELSRVSCSWFAGQI